MRLSRALLACLAILGISHAVASEALIGDTTAPFSADRTVSYRGKTYGGRMYAAPGRQRHEQEIDGLRAVAILRADRQVADILLPDLHVYAEFAFPKSIEEHGSVAELGAPVASDRVAGLQASAYKVERAGSDGSALDGTVWRTADGIIVKVDGAYTSPNGKPVEGAVVLSNIRLGPQDPALFELPKGMAKLDPEAIDTLLSLKVPKPKT